MTCRNLGQLFRENNIETENVNYFDEELTEEKLRDLLRKADLSPLNFAEERADFQRIEYHGKNFARRNCKIDCRKSRAFAASDCRSRRKGGFSQTN